jgi:hypothetical protein
MKTIKALLGLIGAIILFIFLGTLVQGAIALLLYILIPIAVIYGIILVISWFADGCK